MCLVVLNSGYDGVSRWYGFLLSLHVVSPMAVHDDFDDDWIERGLSIARFIH